MLGAMVEWLVVVEWLAADSTPLLAELHSFLYSLLRSLIAQRPSWLGRWRS